MSDSTPVNRTTDPLEIEDDSEFSKIIDTNDRVLVDFYADWCGPCRMMASTINEIADDIDARVLKVNVDDLPKVASRFGVNSIPTFLAFDHGDVSGRLTGMQDAGALRALIE